MKLQILFILIVILGINQAEAQIKKGKLPAYRTEEEKVLNLLRASQKTDGNNILGKAGSLPGNIRYPGEFEESQSVVISWTYDYDELGTVIGVDVSSPYAEVSANLAAEIQKVVPVIIRITKSSDTTLIQNYMAQRGTPVTNAVFMVAPGDDWWARDFGPNGVYYGEHDSLGFIDLKYYYGRDADDVFPIVFAQKMGKSNFVSRLEAEGGNLMADGFGSIFFSEMIESINTHPQLANRWTKQQTSDSVQALFNGKQLFNLDTLKCDGGTGHIDLYIKLIDEQTLMVSEYPDEITASDKQTIENNLQYIASHNSIYGRPYKVYRIPHPTDDDGIHSRVTCEQINADARTFVNGITVNDTYIMPSYSNALNGNKVQTEEVKALMRNIMPGYKVVDIDSRLLSVAGGEIHCITMQIPAENPVLFWHPSVDGYYKELQNAFHIIAKITNRSGINSAKCMWRLKGESDFKTLTLTDSSGYFIGDILAGNVTVTDEIEYYITAITQNGKTATKPMNAANGGYYNIHYVIKAGIDNYLIQAKNYLFDAYPNPSAQQVSIPLYADAKGLVQIVLTDVTGKRIKTIETFSVVGLNEVSFKTIDLNNGIYFYTYILDGNVIATRKLIVNK